ncbi:PepSY domain-containing protein [Mucilaginibacter sp. KACC 22063]|uniref:PepSY domain-containing protein n=1 Tax=Mucilaginibacter sp. KACC 22063 TaxID=3025666 RepID=UPI0023652321|nr:PepSY domain-containing protein [Mucilaginibacter sp. KACC 22063]WDF57047.1 PepSY domain-containing protein [Mucilaginibacter sp. KACC 22063]
MENNNHKLRRNFYKWHRIIGLIALVPVICWTLSGLSHPFMSNWFRPFIPNETFKPLTQAQMKPVMSLQQVLDQNKVAVIRNFGLVDFKGQTYYQVLQADSSYSYYSANDGKVLPDGDKLYATYLARYLTQDSVSKIKRITLQTKFDAQYQPINHLLPVWKVSFLRPDGMDVYIETGQSRMGTFNNNTRKAMLGLFEQFHTWQFLAAIGGEKLRIGVLIVLVGCMFLSMLSGLIVYGFLWNRFKELSEKRKASGKKDTRFVHRFHRQLGLIMSFLMLTFTFSAAFHLIVKLHNIRPESKPYSQLINRDQLQLSNLQLPVADTLIKKVSVAMFENKVYYQVLKRDKSMAYIDAANGKELPDGDVRYASYLADYYRKTSGSTTNIQPGKTELIKQFNEEYGFINKRLPVEKVSYGSENWYIETATAKLATKVAGLDRAEGFSFIFLHKYFGMSWAGKNIRDIVSMLAALGILVVSLFGFAAFLKNQ